MKRFAAVLCLLGAVWCAPQFGWGAVDLVWHPEYQVARVGDTVRVGLYARSDSGSSHAISAIDAIVLHDPYALEFQNLVTDGAPYNWLRDGFFTPSPNDINITIDDGDMLYTAWAQLGVPAYARPGGLLCTTYVFVARTPACAVVISTPASYGTKAKTRVLDGTVPNKEVTGALGSARVMIVEQGVMTSVAEVKQLPDGSFAEIAGPVVTRAFPASGYFYVEDYDRAAGIKVTCAAAQVPAEGTTPTVQGTIRTVDGERVLEAGSVWVGFGCVPAPVPKPLGMMCRAVSQGLSPQGLLVTLRGRATSVGSDSFVLNDGSEQGVRVELHGATPPTQNTYVSVTGAMGADTSGPLLRVNSDGDINEH